jgi:hypothetical protein
MYRTILTLAVLVALSAATALPAAAHPWARHHYIAPHHRSLVYGHVYGPHPGYPAATYHRYRSMHYYYGYPRRYHSVYYPTYTYGGHVGIRTPGFSLHIGY